jgi:hypothetical protein
MTIRHPLGAALTRGDSCPQTFKCGPRCCASSVSLRWRSCSAPTTAIPRVDSSADRRSKTDTQFGSVQSFMVCLVPVLKQMNRLPPVQPETICSAAARAAIDRHNRRFSGLSISIAPIFRASAQCGRLHARTAPSRGRRHVPGGAVSKAAPTPAGRRRGGGTHRREASP